MLSARGAAGEERTMASEATGSSFRECQLQINNQSPTFGGQCSQDQTFYAPDQCLYQQQSSMHPLEYRQSEQVDYAMGAQLYQEDVDILPQPRPRTTKEKKVSRRGGGFRKEEDAVICSAFLNVGNDPITGVNQTLGAYYKRFHDFYNEFKPEGSNRNQLAIQNRWGCIQRSVNKFCGFKSAVDRRNESGKNEQDRIDDAVRIYEARKPFQFMHCWKILRNESKWNDKVLELNNISAGTGGEESSQANSGHGPLAEGDNDNTMPGRPEGRDAAKRKRTTDASSSSTAAEVLQRIHDNKEKCQQKEDEQMVHILTRKDEKLCLQREFLNLKKQQREENLILRQQEASNAAMHAEAQLLAAGC